MRAGSVVAGRFVVEACVARGGMGVVYRGRDAEDDRPVAIKVVEAADETLRARFLREASLVADLWQASARIVRYVAHGQLASGELYLVMEWLEGEDLGARLRRDALTLSESLQVVAHAAEALVYAHARGVVHRDLKPSNLFLVNGEVSCLKVIDFGVARVDARSILQTSSGLLLGTPLYMSPEQARGDSAIGPAADVFTLGAVLYRCLTGSTPFHGDNVLDLCTRIMNDEPQALALRRPDIPSAVADLVHRMLAKEPASRPADAAALFRELERLGTPSSTVRAPRALTERDRRLAACLMVLGVAMDSVVDVASRFHAAVDVLPDGALLLSMGHVAAPIDQTLVAARLALAVRQEHPDTTMALMMGGDDPSDPGALAQVMLRARSLASAAGRGSIAVDPALVGVLEGRFELASQPRCLIAERTPRERSTAFVGRDRELALVRAVLRECSAELVGRAVVVTAPPGMGKTRLYHELSADLPAQLERWHVSGDPMTAGAPLSLLGQLLRAACPHADALGRRVTRTVAITEAARVTEFLSVIAGFPLRRASALLRAARQDPVVMSDQLRRAWEDFTAAQCATGPLLIVLDDLQWGDEATVRFIDGALRACRDLPLTVLALGRPELHELFPRLWANRSITHIELPELSRGASEKLARELMNGAAETRIASVAERSLGNPFFLEELSRSEGDSTPTPSIMAVLQSRLAGLSALHRRVLRAASVFGLRFTRPSLLHLLSDTEDRRVDGVLRDLIERDVFVRRDDALAFRHSLIRETAYDMLSRDDRVLGHRLAAEYLETNGEKDAALLADHFFLGESRGRAGPLFALAADVALGAGDLAGATAYARRAAGCDLEPAALGRVKLIEAEALMWQGDSRSAGAAAEDAIPLLSDGSARIGAVSLALLMAFRTGESRRVVAHAEQLREAAADNAQVAAAGIGVARACVGLLTAGQYALARSLLAVLPDPETVDPLIAAWVRRAHALRALHAGSYEAYLHASELAARDFAEAGDVRNANVLLGNAGHALLELGDTLEAIRRLRAVEGSMVSMGLARLAYTDVALGLALARAGDLAGAEAQVSGARDAYERMKDSVLMGISASALSSILRQRGDLARAEEEARTAVLLLSHVPPWRPVAAARLAGVLLDRGAAEEALRFAERAVADLDALGSVPVGESLVRLTHAVAMRACSPPKAARAIAAARSRLLERAAGITSAARRETFLTSVPENARTLSLFEEWRDDRTLVPHD